MEIPTGQLTAAGRVVRLLSDDGAYSWCLQPALALSMRTWTEAERTAVVNAARNNRSLQRLVVNLERMGDETAETFAGISSQLSHVKDVVLSAELAESTLCVDEVLYGFMKSQSPVTDFHMSGISSSHAFLDFCERFPLLERLAIEGQVGSVGTASCEEFSKAVAAGIGQLSLLHNVSLNCDGLGLSTLRLLLALEASAKSKKLRFVASECSKELLVDMSRFFRNSTNVESVTIAGKQLLDISSFIDNECKRPFSHFLKEMQFFSVDVTPLLRHRLDVAAEVMQNVESVSFGMCRVPAAALLELLKKLPQLKAFVCVSRDRCEQQDDDEFHDNPSPLETNDDLEGLCDVIEMKVSVLHSICLDVVSRDYRPLPAVVRLLHGCKGDLALNLARLPETDCAHLIAGVAGVRKELNTLCLRFHCCLFDDTNYAAILRAFESNQTLWGFELGFDTQANLGTPERSIAAIRHLIKSNNTFLGLSLRGLSNAAAAALLESIAPVLATTNRSLRLLRLHADLTSFPHVLQSICNMLTKNHILAVLQGCKFPKNNPLTTQILHLLKQNACGRWLLHGDSCTRFGAPAPMGLWGSVLSQESMRNDPKLMYAFLRAKPDLVQPKVAPMVLRRSRRIEELADAKRLHGVRNRRIAPPLDVGRNAAEILVDPSEDRVTPETSRSGLRRRKASACPREYPTFQGSRDRKRLRLTVSP